MNSSIFPHPQFKAPKAGLTSALSRTLAALCAAAALLGVRAGGQTLVSQATSNFTAAQTTTITAVDANSNPKTYASGNMDDVNASGGSTITSVSTSTYLVGDGGGTVINTGVSSVKFGTTTYSLGAGDTYTRTGFYIDTGNFFNPTQAATASTAGVAFRILGNDMGATTGYFYVGVDLVKIGDKNGTADTGSSASVGTANIDFFIGVKLTENSSNTPISKASAQVFIAGATSSADDSTATTVPDTANVKNIGSLIPIGGSVSDSTYTGEYAFVKNGTGDDNNEISFGALFTDINSDLQAIYGASTAIQWDQGDLVRFVPFSLVGTTYDFMGINSSQGGTGTLPFGSNGTAAITDAYRTDSSFDLTRQSVDGFDLGVVPEPSTYGLIFTPLVLGFFYAFRCKRHLFAKVVAPTGA